MSSLALLPAEHIVSRFIEVVLTIPDACVLLKEFVEYMSCHWIYSEMHPVESWSVFGLSIRTNNDQEEYHNRLNRLATQHRINLYKLINILHEKTICVKHAQVFSAIPSVNEYKLTQN